jgi:hypothetical protein
MGCLLHRRFGRDECCPLFPSQLRKREPKKRPGHAARLAKAIKKAQKSRRKNFLYRPSFRSSIASLSRISSATAAEVGLLRKYSCAAGRRLDSSSPLLEAHIQVDRLTDAESREEKKISKADKQIRPVVLCQFLNDANARHIRLAWTWSNRSGGIASAIATQRD